MTFFGNREKFVVGEKYLLHRRKRSDYDIPGLYLGWKPVKTNEKFSPKNPEGHLFLTADGRGGFEIYNIRSAYQHFSDSNSDYRNAVVKQDGGFVVGSQPLERRKMSKLERKWFEEKVGELEAD
jgi:hypothetical protein